MNLTKQQVQQAIQAGVAQGVKPQDMIKEMESRGYIMEGYNDGTNQAYQQQQQQAQTVGYTMPEEKKTVGGFVGNVFKSTGSLIGNTVKAAVNVFNPDSKKNTLANLGRVALGVAEKVVPGRQGAEDQADALGQFFKQRYGSWDAIKNTMYEDPAGVALDLASILSGGGAAIKAAGLAGKTADLERIVTAANAVSKAEKAAAIEAAIKSGQLGTAAKVGQTVAKAGETVNPITQATKLAGKGLQMATEGRTLGFGKPVAEVQEAATRQGVDLNAGAVNQSKSVKFGETFAGNNAIVGRKMVDKVTAAETRLKEIADSTVTAAGKTGNAEEAGLAAAKGAKAFKEEFKTFQDAQWKEVSQNIRNQTAGLTAADVAEAKAIVDDILQTKKAAWIKNPKGAKILQGIQKRLAAPEQQTLEGLRSTVRELNETLSASTDPIITGSKGQLTKVTAKLDEAFNGAFARIDPTGAAKFEQLSNSYREGLGRINTSYGSKIKELADAGQYSEISAAVMNPGTSLEDIPKIMKMVGEEAADELRASFLQKTFSKASSNVKGNQAFKQGGLTSEIKNLGKGDYALGDAKMKAILSPTQYQNLKDLETLSKALEGSQSLANASPTFWNGRTYLLFSGAVLHPSPVTWGAVIGDTALSKWIISNAGQNFLKNGGIKLDGALGKALIKASQKAGKSVMVGNQVNNVNESVGGR